MTEIVVKAAGPRSVETDRQVEAMLPPPSPAQITSALLRTFRRASLARDSPWPKGDETPASQVKYLESAPKTAAQRTHAARLAQAAYAAYCVMTAAETAEGSDVVQRIHERLRRILNVALLRHRETKPARNKQI